MKLNFEPWALEVLKAYLSALEPPKSREEAWARAHGGLCWWLDRYFFRSRGRPLKLYGKEQELRTNLLSMAWSLISYYNTHPYTPKIRAKERWRFYRFEAIRLCDLLLRLHKKAKEKSAKGGMRS